MDIELSYQLQKNVNQEREHVLGILVSVASQACRWRDFLFPAPLMLKKISLRRVRKVHVVVSGEMIHWNFGELQYFCRDSFLGSSSLKHETIQFIAVGMKS